MTGENRKDKIEIQYHTYEKTTVGTYYYANHYTCCYDINDAVKLMLKLKEDKHVRDFGVKFY